MPFEDYIPINAVVPKDPERQLAITRAMMDKFTVIQFINIRGEAPFAIGQKAKEIGMVRALIGERLFAIVGDEKGLSQLNRQTWARLVYFAQDTAAVLSQCKNPIKQTAANYTVPKKLLR